MSADTYLSLRECKDEKGRFYELELRTSEGELIEPICVARDLRRAMMVADAYQQDNEVEYGLSFFPLKED